MKLNNYGFGMRDMIIYSCILLFVLIFVTIEINSFYSDLENRPPKETNQYVTDNDSSKKDESKDKDIHEEEKVDYDYYNRLENRLYDAAKKYLTDNRFDLSEDIQKISLDTLVNLKYMDSITDQKGNRTCSAYVNAYEIDGELIIKPYLACYNYRTEGH